MVKAVLRGLKKKYNKSICLVDTERGVGQRLFQSNRTEEATIIRMEHAFNSDGFTGE
jgi:hypothetical protein